MPKCRNNTAPRQRSGQTVRFIAATEHGFTHGYRLYQIKNIPQNIDLLSHSDLCFAFCKTFEHSCSLHLINLKNQKLIRYKTYLSYLKKYPPNDNII